MCTNAAGGVQGRSLDVLAEVAETLRVALDTAARQFFAGQHVGCSLALLPAVALGDTSPRWGRVGVIPREKDHHQLELVVGVDAVMLTEALADYFDCRQKQRQQHVCAASEVKSAAPLIGPVVETLTQDLIAVALLFFPAHGDLWNARRRWLKTTLGTKTANENNASFVLMLLREILLTSLLVSCHAKRQEIWVHRCWVVQQLVALGGIHPDVFQAHDRAVLLEAADRHPMNYNAWNYRRQVFTLFFHSGKVQKSGDTGLSLLLFQEVDSVVHFFERHNGDTSAVSYLFFLLEQATAQRDAAGDGSGSRALCVWRRLLAVTARELRRHFDKGHEAVWVLRLALVRWALRERVLCGWTLRDELRFVVVYTALAEWGEENGTVPGVSWVDISGSHRWTAYHASRYGIQLLRVVQAKRIA